MTMENRFNAGDLVWAKVHRYPWWPSIIYHEALSSTKIRTSKKEGCMLVSFYGDNTYEWLDPKNLIPFEANFNLYSKRRHSDSFVKAVNEAVDEVKHRAAIGLSCPCKFFAQYKPAPVEDLLEVDIEGYQLGTVFTVKQIEDFRQEFKPVETLSFIQQLALDSSDIHLDLNQKKEAARALAYRKANYEEVDEPYYQAFEVDPKSLGSSIVASDDQKTCLNQGKRFMFEFKYLMIMRPFG
ncbi:putative PWWP domain-containing protein [Helianthus annuus]|nr:putative PWWP domain-containing protein [Helianthus annuus]